MSGTTRHATHHRLGAGTLTLTSDTPRADLPVRIAERRNPKRAFLFVSTLLGRHIPVDPRRLRWATDTLAARVAPHLGDGPVLVAGFAETAIGLGAGVFDALRRVPRPAGSGSVGSGPVSSGSVSYLPTTRFPTAPEDVWFTLSEDHSHAPDHTVLRPAEGVWPEGGVPPGEGEADATLVLVDDETTTGSTFAALAAGFAARGLRFARVVTVTLTDWSSGEAVRRIAPTWPGARVASVALARGTWRWDARAGAEPPAPPAGRAPICDPWSPSRDGPFAAPRLGLAGGAPGPDGEALWAALRGRGLDAVAPGERVLVIGTGEHVWQPFLLAEAMAARHARVGLVATTRSPIAEGPVIAHKSVFPDHYGLGREMYLHNADPTAWDRAVIWTETGMDGLADGLLDDLSAHPRAQAIDGEGNVRTLRAARTAAA